jgi:hypothetical protein
MNAIERCLPEMVCGNCTPDPSFQHRSGVAHRICHKYFTDQAVTSTTMRGRVTVAIIVPKATAPVTGFTGPRWADPMTSTAAVSCATTSHPCGAR